MSFTNAIAGESGMPRGVTCPSADNQSNPYRATNAIEQLKQSLPSKVSAADLLADQIQRASEVANSILYERWPDDAKKWIRMDLAEKLRYIRSNLKN